MQNVENSTISRTTNRGGGTKGQGGGLGPPKNSSGWAKVCLPPPPPNFDRWPPKPGASGQNHCQIASEHPEMCRIFKILSLWQASKGRSYSSGGFKLRI